MKSLLDNIMWHVLTGPHARFASGGATAKRYARGLSPIVGFADPAAPDLAALAPHVEPGEHLYCGYAGGGRWSFRRGGVPAELLRSRWTSTVGEREHPAQQPGGRIGGSVGQRLVLTMNCLNGYFHLPYYDTLSEELLKAEGKGAVTVVSPSGMSLNTPAHVYHKALLEEILGGGHERLGDAVLAAKKTYAATGLFPELLTIYHVFGDPALRLREP